jgi:hypothetical protein
MLIYKNDSDVITLVEAFEKRTLPKAEWTHAAHLTVALYYCLSYPFGTARNLMRDGIYWLNDAHGTPNTKTGGYHETLTFFWMNTVREFLENHKNSGGLADTANSLVTVCHDAKLPLRFYSRELLFSPKARAHYVEPDLIKEAEAGDLLPQNFPAEAFA